MNPKATYELPLTPADLERRASQRVRDAAPKLLRTCEVVLASLRTPVEGSVLADIHALKAAIAEAKGEKP